MTDHPAFEHANASWVTDYLLVGGDLDYDDELAVRQAKELEAAGVTHILDLRSEWSDEDLVASVAPGITYRHYGVEDLGQHIPAEWFQELTDWAGDVLADPEARLLVHCHMGVNRGPSAAFAILLAQGWEALDALAAIRSARPEAAILYSASALEWFLHDRETTIEQRAGAFLEHSLWHREHPHDTIGVIERIRRQEDRKIADLQRRHAPARLLSGDSEYAVSDGTQVYLLTWNPRRQPDDGWFGQAVRLTGRRKRVERAWRVAVRQDFHKGDRVYLLRQGQEPRGIIASGFISADGCEQEPARRRTERGAKVVKVSWDVVLNTDEVLSLPRLRQRFPKVNWVPTRSGVLVDSRWSQPLEQAWLEHVEQMYLDSANPER